MVFLSGGESVQIGLIVVKRRGYWDLINCFNPTYLCVCPKPEPGFPTSYVEVFFVFRVCVFVVLISVEVLTITVVFIKNYSNN